MKNAKISETCWMFGICSIVQYLHTYTALYAWTFSEFYAKNNGTHYYYTIILAIRQKKPMIKLGVYLYNVQWLLVITQILYYTQL